MGGLPKSVTLCGGEREFNGVKAGQRANDAPAVNGPFADEGQPHRERPEHDGNGLQNHGQHSSGITNSFCRIDNLRVSLSDGVCRSRSKQTLPVRDKGLRMGLLRSALRIRSPWSRYRDTRRDVRCSVEWPGLSLLEVLNVLNRRAPRRGSRQKRELAIEFLSCSLPLSMFSLLPRPPSPGDTQIWIQATRPNVLGRINYPRRRGEKPMTKSNFRAVRVGTADPDAVFTVDPLHASLIDDYPPCPVRLWSTEQTFLIRHRSRTVWSIPVECIALEQEDIRPWPIFSLWCA